MAATTADPASRPSIWRERLASLSRQLVTLDPGGVRLYRGFQLIVAVLLAAVIGNFVQGWLDAPKSPAMGLNAAVIVVKAMLFTLPGSRRSETVSALQLCAIMLAVYVSAIVIGWGDLGLGPLPAQIAWVAFIAAGLYLRRYGAAGFRCGIVLAITFMFVVVFEPTRAEAVWWLPAVAIGAVSVTAVYMLAWRPSATQAFDRLHARLRDKIVAILNSYIGSSGNGPEDVASGELRDLWSNMARASDFAAAASPGDSKRLENLLARSLRMVMALEVVVQQFAKNQRRVLDETVIQHALENITACLMSDPDDKTTMDGYDQSLREARVSVLARSDLENDEKLQLLRILTGLLRLLISYRGAGPTREQEARPKKENAEKDDKALSGNALGLRLALQAGFSAAVVVALGAVFGLQQTFWALLTIIVVISASWGATVNRILQRVPGVVLGVLFAVALQWQIGAHEVLQGILVAAAFAPVFVLSDRHYAIASFLIGFGLATGVSLVKGDTLMQMLSLGYETAIGGAVALVAAQMLFPIRSSDHLRPLLKRLLSDGSQVIQSAAARRLDIESDTALLERDALDLADEMTNIGSERLLTRASGPGTRLLQAHADALATYIPLFAELLDRLSASDLSESYHAQLNDLADKVSTVLDDLYQTAMSKTHRSL